MLKTSTLIMDGYTARASSRELGIIIDYRPMTLAERQWSTKAMHDYDSGEVICECLARKVVAFNRDEISSGVLLRWLKSDNPLWNWIFDLIAGDHREREEADADNINTGLPLYLRYRHLGHDTCSTCQKYLFDPESGELELDGIGGDPVPRFPEAILACQTEEGCPNGTPENPKSLTSKNIMALRHYQECVAVGNFPDDPIVHHNAALFKQALHRSLRDARLQSVRPQAHG